MTDSIEDRFEAKVDRSGGPDSCHPWTAGRFTGMGYGQFWVGTKTRLAHRWAYEYFVGPIPEGLHVLHRCDNPPCVNLVHLFLGTRSDNMADKVAKGRQFRPVGERNGRAKITEDDVREIRRRASQGEVQRVIAIEYGIRQPSVSDIVQRKTWSDQ